MCQLWGRSHRPHVSVLRDEIQRRDSIESDFEEDQYTGTLKVDGKEYQVYISRMEDCIIFVNGGRTADGTFTGKFLKKKRKFTLIEM